MRAIFVVLLVANLAYGGWALWQSRERPAVINEPPSVALKSTASLADFPIRLEVVTGKAQAAAASASGRSAAADCKLLGSWSTQQQAMAARLALPPELGEPITVKRVSHKPDLDWVFLAPFDSHKDAERVLGMLQKQQFDSFIVDTGDDANAISLGYFSNHQLALGLQKRLQKKGYAVAIRPTEHDFNVWWLRFDAAMVPKLQAYMATSGTQQALKLQSCDGAD